MPRAHIIALQMKPAEAAARIAIHLGKRKGSHLVYPQNKSIKLHQGTMADRRTQMRLIMAFGRWSWSHSALFLDGQTRNKYEVCVNFKGMVHCATASGPLPTAAIRSAQDIDCSMLANGRDDYGLCRPPAGQLPRN